MLLHSMSPRKCFHFLITVIPLFWLMPKFQKEAFIMKMNKEKL